MNTFTLKELTNILLATEAKAINRFAYSKLYATLLLVVTDMFGVFMSFMIAMLFQYFFWGISNDGSIFSLPTVLLTLPLFPFGYALAGMYPAYGINQVQEFRNLTITSILVYLLLAIAMLIGHDLSLYPSFVYAFSCLLVICSVPMCRALFRKIASKYEWWGVPVIIIGAGEVGAKTIANLHRQISMGLRPMLVIDDDSDKWGYIDNVPVIGGLNIIPEVSKKLAIDYAIVAVPNTSVALQSEIIKENAKYFNNLTVLSEVFGLSNTWVTANDLGGILGFEVQRKLLKKSAQIKKRVFDIVFATILLIATSPLQLLIAMAIKLDSSGKVIFRHDRMGANGKKFRMIKYRSMYFDAEKKLSDLLGSNHEMRQEFELFHKLDDDPRITRVGRLLRKYSLDELPQFINVIKGDMSLIGPRAYIVWEWEKCREKGLNDLMIFKVKPGISGLWQVANRDSSFEDRVKTDTHYVSNWSFLADIMLVGKTIIAILKGTGS